LASTWGDARTGVTDETGSYLLRTPVGLYRLDVSLEGFRSYAQTGLLLTVGATPTVTAALELGSLEETITVSLDPRTWININGWYHSEEVHVIERLRRPSLNDLEWQFTVEDPEVLTSSSSRSSSAAPNSSLPAFPEGCQARFTEQATGAQRSW
jgi:hypothetical protein